jgi:soluble lytic murein transglycosylase-like protein
MQYAWLSFLFLLSSTVHAACFDHAAARYGLPVDLLWAISRVESSGNSAAIHRNTDGSHDIGHLQINSLWLPELRRHGIDERTLRDPCTNTQVGAWILAQNFRHLGYSWRAVGAYNAATDAKRLTYARKVAAALRPENRQ